METLIKTFGSMMASSAACFQCQTRPSSTIHGSSSENKKTLTECSQPLGNISLKKCSRCRVVLYCNNLCQTQHWNDSHKKLCSSMKYLQRLRELDFATTNIISRDKRPPFSFAF